MNETHDHVLPKPGDLIIAKRQMRAWINQRERGRDGVKVEPGDSALMLQVWFEGRRFRMQVLVKDQIVMFSHALHCVALNWSYGEVLAT